jgi:GNAT superfamily N-acetyltransferase
VTARVTVRSATPDDAAALVALLEAGALGPTDDHRDDLAPYREALADIAATPGADVLVAELDGRAVGMCQVVTFRHLQHRGGRCAELESMHVAPDLRGHGVGGVLVEAAVEAARAEGCYRVQLTSNAARADAHRFYAAHGFTASHVGFKRLLPAPGA